MLLKSGLLFLFLVLLTMGQFFYHRPKTDLAQPYFDFELKNIEAFDISYFTTKLSFKKENQLWFVYSHQQNSTQEHWVPAKQTEVVKALTYLTTQTFSNPVSNDAQACGINETGLKLDLYTLNQQKLKTVFIGKQGPDGMSSYIKGESEKQIFLADQNFNNWFLRERIDWQETAP